MEPSFLYDDAYITLHSAQALLSGVDARYPGTPPLAGVTSPFHVVLTAVLATVLSGPAALLIVGLVGAAAYGWGIVAVARNAGLPPGCQLSLVMAGLGTGMVSQHFVNGLETSWALAAVVWSWHLAGSSGRLRWLAALCGLLPFVRPELGVWAAFLLGRAALANRRHAPILLGLAILTAAPWAALLWSQTGQVVPTTFTAKRDWYAEGCWSMARRLTTAGAALGLWLFISAGLLAGGFGLWLTTLGRLALASFAVWLAVWSASIPSLLYGYHRHRYFSLGIAFLVGGMCALPDPWRRRLCYLAAAAAILTTAPIVVQEPRRVADANAYRGELVRLMRAAQADRVVVHDAGYLAWAAAAPTFVDMVGLKTRLAASLNARWTGPSCGANRGTALAELADRTQARYLLLWEPWDQAFRVRDGLASHGWISNAVGSTSGPEPIVLYKLCPPAGVGRVSPACPEP
jgi:hypothetical protein